MVCQLDLFIRRRPGEQRQAFIRHNSVKQNFWLNSDNNNNNNKYRVHVSNVG